MTTESHLEARQSRRMASDHRFLTRLEKREAAAEKLVGELCREGQTVHYINQLDRNGRLTGKVVEFTGYLGVSRAITYLLRNNYV